MRRGFGLLMLLMLPAALESSSTSPPGKPVLVGCRSPDKETFTCWWDPGSDGGLPTVHHLYYTKENVKGIHECPDYRSAGKNSCFFNQAHTNLWSDYSLRVVAFNALGNTSSDQLEIDVMRILKPYAVENVTVLVNNSINTPFLYVSWKSPLKTSKSGWVTLTYELRFKQKESQDWRVVPDIKENAFKLYNVDPGTLYMVQVRCKIDHGAWSEWSNSTLAKIPNHIQDSKPFWILVLFFSTIPLLAAVCILFLKRKILKQWLLPPVPGPKISGVDVQLLKSGRSEEVVSALTANQNFPPMVVWMEQAEEFLILSDSSDWLLADSCKSQKNNKNLLISAGLHVDLEIQHKESSPGQCDRDKNEVSKDEMGHFGTTTESQSKDNLSEVEPLQLPPEKLQSPGVNFVDKEGTLLQEATSEKTSQPVAATGYVDIQQQENTPEAAVTQWDYSRVEEVNGETILILKNENISVSSDIQRQEGNVEEDMPSEYSRVREVNSDMVFLQNYDSSDSLCKKKGDHNPEWTNQKSEMPHVTDCSKAMFLEIIGNGYVDSVPKFSTK